MRMRWNPKHGGKRNGGDKARDLLAYFSHDRLCRVILYIYIYIYIYIILLLSAVLPRTHTSTPSNYPLFPRLVTPPQDCAEI